jgi:hypothetical protein
MGGNGRRRIRKLAGSIGAVRGALAGFISLDSFRSERSVCGRRRSKLPAAAGREVKDVGDYSSAPSGDSSSPEINRSRLKPVTFSASRNGPCVIGNCCVEAPLHR